MNGRVARLIRKRATINPQEKTVDKKLIQKLKKEHHGKKV